MARTARVVAVGAPHHITQRGNDRQQVFLSDEDRQFYLATLADSCRRYEISVLGYFLMTNHAHLVAIPGRPDSLSGGVKDWWTGPQFRECGKIETHSMARKARVVAADVPHHVTQLGNNRPNVFLSDDDGRYYLSALRGRSRRASLRLPGNCLMTNHATQ